ncbi:lamin tail domain-containing protein [Candidatus Amarolinea dominans]|uniref:lamin tail domain-containing protein n=1 Tax=Candidatus Amarolinea dominans TaxID=3140696 RepID=UPI0031CC3E61
MQTRAFAPRGHRTISGSISLLLSVLAASLLILAAAVLASANAHTEAPEANDLRVSQVYGGGGNAGATYTNDFIELFNAGAGSINLSGWSVQYASATGTSWQVTNLSGSLVAGHYYLIQEAQGAGGTTPLPTPDATGTIAMSGSQGKVALVNSTTALSGACPTGASIIDFIGFGAANCYEGLVRRRS